MFISVIEIGYRFQRFVVCTLSPDSYDEMFTFNMIKPAVGKGKTGRTEDCGSANLIKSCPEQEEPREGERERESQGDEKRSCQRERRRERIREATCIPQGDRLRA